MIDAKEVSAAHRARYFWGNLPGMNRWVSKWWAKQQPPAYMIYEIKSINKEMFETVKMQLDI